MFFLVFLICFRLKVVFAQFWRFPVNSLLTEFAKQRNTLHIDVVKNCLALYCGISDEFRSLFCGWQLQHACIVWEGRVVTHISDSAGMFSPVKCSSFPLQTEIQSNYGQFHCILSLIIDSVFIGQFGISVRDSAIAEIIGPCCLSLCLSEITSYTSVILYQLAQLP